MRVTLHELEAYWSIDDLLDAHLTIQVHEQAHRLQMQRMREKSESRRPARR